MQWLGGVIQELWKRKGDPRLIGNFRDITLADGDGKDFGSFLLRRCRFDVGPISASCWA